MGEIKIIIPTYNRPDQFKQCLTSVLNAVDKKFQIHVQDNSDNQDTKSIVDAIGSSQVSYKKNLTNLPMLQNWAAALAHVDTEYFVRVDDDCVVLPNFGDFMLGNLDADVLYGLGYYYKNSGLYTIIEEDVMKLNSASRQKLILAEYFGLLDTNYCRYKTATVKRVLGDIKNAYQYSLPDRHLNYKLFQDADTNIQFKSAKIGISRFDRVMASDWRPVKLVNIKKEILSPTFKSSDAQSNLSFLRAHTAYHSLDPKIMQSPECRGFLNLSSLIISSLYGSMNDLNIQYCKNKLSDLVLIYFEILKLTISEKNFKINGKSRAIFLIICTRRFLISFTKLLIKTKKNIPNNVGQFTKKGNEIIDEVIKYNLLPKHDYKPENYFPISSDSE